MDDTQNFRDDMKLITDVAYKVRALCNSEEGLGWIAKQSVSERQPHDDLYGFVIGKGFTAVRVQDARNATYELLHQLATEVMGYAPGSAEDWQERKRIAARHITTTEDTITSAQQSLEYWRKVYANANAALAAPPVTNE